MNLRSLLAIATLIGLCLVCLVALDQVSQALRDRQAVVLPSIDYVLQQVSLTRHRAGGDGRVQLVAQRVIHQRETDELEVHLPELRRLGAGEDVSARADRARVHSDNDRIDLHGDVRLERGQPDRNMVLTTTSLHVQVEAQTARTVDPVEIRQGASILGGRGLEADLKAARYVILADLKARYVPVPRNVQGAPTAAPAAPSAAPAAVSVGLARAGAQD